MIELTQEQRRNGLRFFTLLFAIATVVVIAIPAVLAYLGTPRGGQYLGYQFNTDDHMVYSAWMRQAIDGRILFDNRFTTDPQPGLTLNLYFLFIGWLAKLTGISFASFLARLFFSALFIGLLSRLLRRLDPAIYAHKLAIALAVLGGGLGFLVWHNFGREIVRPAPDILKSAMLGRLPTDIWQPEGFVFPSMLTNSLFMVSLCLIVYSLTCFLDARDSWKPVLPGAIAMGVLMNIHSYDVLLVGLTMIGFLAMTIAQKQTKPDWVMRAVAIAAGVLPAALWFVYVLQKDPVFQARAATETYSANFRSVVFGYLPMMLLAFAGMGLRQADKEVRLRRLMGLGLILLLFATLFVLSTSHVDGYFLTSAGWGVAFAVALAGLVLISDERPAWNLLAAWAVIGVVAIYFPALFQRKLAMGLSVPWCVLAAFGLQKLLEGQERSGRNLATVLALIVLGATSLRWFVREIQLVRNNVSTTTLHPVYLSPDVVKIRDYLNRIPGRKVIIAPPGQALQFVDNDTQKLVPDEFGSPLMPDLNSIITGTTGAYSYAGHWSETPDYNRKIPLLYKLFYQDLPQEQRSEILETTKAEFLVAPVPEAFDSLSLPDLSGLGEVVLDGTQFRLIKVSGSES